MENKGKTKGKTKGKQGENIDNIGPTTMNQIWVKLKVYHLPFVLSWKSQCNSGNVPTITGVRNHSTLNISGCV